MGKLNRIKEWRERQGLTLDRLAELSHLSASYLQRMESGERNVSLKNLERICAALNVSQRDLVVSNVFKVPVVGYVGAGAETLLYGEGQGPFDEVEPPDGSTKKTVAVEIRGDSLGPILNGWRVFYDDVHEPPRPELLNELCVLGLNDGRILVKKLTKGQLEGRFTLLSNTEPPIYDEAVKWAAPVRGILPKR